ncbi:MAG: hypothetical protein ACE5FD_07220 [Anaerolineae bacterium]
MKVIIDFDGTLTAEEAQAAALAAKILHTLADEILEVPLSHLTTEFEQVRRRAKAQPHLYRWVVNGLTASYADEGAFILNTTSVQVLLRENEKYLERVTAVYPNPEYDPVTDCMNALFHRHSAELSPEFRPETAVVLNELLADPNRSPVILTNSLGDKVQRHLATLPLAAEMPVLGDTRQYEMAPDWQQTFPVENGTRSHFWQPLADFPIDLRRPAYYRALQQAQAEKAQVAVVADTLSLPGALPMVLGIPFFLLRTAYTPDWCLQVVAEHPMGRVLSNLGELPKALRHETS